MVTSRLRPTNTLDARAGYGYAELVTRRPTLEKRKRMPELLEFLRGDGCVAYYEGGGIEAVRPHSFGEQEATELRLVVNRWRNEHPEVQIELRD